MVASEDWAGSVKWRGIGGLRVSGGCRQCKAVGGFSQDTLKDEAEPGGETLGVAGQGGVDFLGGHPLQGLGFLVDELWPAGDGCGEDVVEFVFGQAAGGVGGLVGEGEQFGQIGVEADFFAEAEAGGVGGGLSRRGVAAAGVGPEEGEVVFGAGALLEEHSAVGVEEEDGEGAVELAGGLVGAELFFGAEFVVVLVNEDDALAVGMVANSVAHG